MRVITYNLNTQAPNGTLKPYNKANLACVSWNVAWAGLFRNARQTLDKRDVKCRLRVQFQSVESASLTYANNFGQLTMNLGTSSQNNERGCIVGITQLKASAITAGSRYIEVDTTSTLGIEINVPVDQTDFTICLWTALGVLQTNVPEYQCTLHFELEDEEE